MDSFKRMTLIMLAIYVISVAVFVTCFVRVAKYIEQHGVRDILIRLWEGA